MRAQNILELVDDEQREAVLADPGPLLVVAGAGTGKTRTLTCRIAHRVATRALLPSAVLAVTHSTRAAGEMRDRLSRFGVDGLELVSARTVHSAALAQLRHFWPATGRGGELVVCDDRYARMRAGLARLGAREVSSALVADLLSEVEWAKSQMLSPAGYGAAASAARRATPVDHNRVARAFEAYQAELERHGELDFTDLLTHTARLIETDEAVAAQVRARYRTLCVDEYQDVDPAQQRLLDAWLGASRDLTAVGDPRQAIYGFKGADPGLLTTFPQRYPGTRVLALTRNYRSSPQVVAVANRLSAAADPDPGPRPRARAGRAAWDAAHPAPLTATRPDGATPTVRAHEEEAAEATWVGAQVSNLLRSDAAASQVAVLVRYNSQLAPFEQVLTSAGIPYRVADGERFFDRPDIVAVTTEMQRRMHASQSRAASFDPEDTDGGGADLLSGASLLREVLHDAGFDRGSPPAGVGASRDRWESLLALLHLVESLPSAELLGAGELLDDLTVRRQQAHQVTRQAVTLATIHKAKGLEWDHVFCPRWVEGSVPSAFARTEAAIEEERRLGYVALTRARRSLTLTWARTRALPRGNGDRSSVCAPSRFLPQAGFTLTDGDTTVAAPPKAGRGRREQKVNRCRRCATPLQDPSLVALGACTTHLSGEAGARLVRLREWRTETARLDNVPVFRVLTDATLLALVALAPTTTAELGEINGIGPAKLARYGSELLSRLHRHPTA